MSPLARSLLALAVAALLQSACAHRRSNRRSAKDASVSLGEITGQDVENLPQIHIGIPDVIITIPNDCDPYGYLRRDLLGSEVIVSNANGYGPSPVLVAADHNNAQSDVEIHCEEETDEDGNVIRCPEGVDVRVLQFCRLRLQN